MSRADELRNVFKDVDAGKRTVIDRLIDEAVFLEQQMTALKKYPFIKIHPTNPELQKVTAAGKQYREYLQTYTNIIRALERMLNGTEVEEESPLRVYFKKIKAEIR
jgi:hypothetical protein